MDDNKKGLKDSFVDALVSLGPALTAGAGSKDVGLIVTHFFLSLLLTVANALPA